MKLIEEENGVRVWECEGCGKTMSLPTKIRNPGCEKCSGRCSECGCRLGDNTECNRCSKFWRDKS